MKLQKVLDKDPPLDEVMDFVDGIMVGEAGELKGQKITGSKSVVKKTIH